MTQFFRAAVLGLAVYGFFVLGFPSWEGRGYHPAMLLLILGGAFALHVMLKFFRITSLFSALIFEFCFGLGLVLYLGWTMPQKSGKSPILLWAEGQRPNQAAARRGLERLRLDPDSKVGTAIVRFFPKR